MTIGIYTAIYFMVNVIVMVCGGFAPLVWIFMPTILSLICGVIYMPLMAKVQKPKNGFKVRDTGKYRGYETDCTDTCFIYLLHSSDTTLNARSRVHIVLEIFI